ncbi:MAG: hypothetical protein ACT4P6_13925 [Gemmatimonadaceae bacterium]
MKTGPDPYNATIVVVARTATEPQFVLFVHAIDVVGQPLPVRR